MFINSKKEELESIGELSKVCSQIVLKCLYLARIGRPDIQWSVNELASSVTKSTQACEFGKIDIIHSLTTDKFVMWVTQHCRLGSDFAGDLEDSKSTSGVILCIFGSRTFVPIDWVCKKQTPSIPQCYRIRNHFVGCCSANGWITCSLDLWDVVLRSTKSTKTPTNPASGNSCDTGNCSRNRKSKPKQTGNRDIEQLSHVDHVLTITHSFRSESQLFIF